MLCGREIEGIFKEHLCALSGMIPLVYHHIHPLQILRIQRIFKRIFMCRQIWTHWVQQKSLEYVAVILKNIFNLQMKFVIFQLRPNQIQYAGLFQHSRLASKVLMLHSKRSSSVLFVAS